MIHLTSTPQTVEAHELQNLIEVFQSVNPRHVTAALGIIERTPANTEFTSDIYIDEPFASSNEEFVLTISLRVKTSDTDAVHLESIVDETITEVTNKREEAREHRRAHLIAQRDELNRRLDILGKE